MLINKNFTPGRNGHRIDTITIHHMAGRLTLEQCRSCFTGSRRASSNYGIDAAGRVAMYVREEDTSWCSSSTANDSRAVTVELANDEIGGDWHVSDFTMQACVELCYSICVRNEIKRLVWRNDPMLLDRPELQNMTIHRWFKNKLCPGRYVEDNLAVIARDVNDMLNCTPKQFPDMRYTLYLSGAIPDVLMAVVNAAGYKCYRPVEYGKECVRTGNFKTAATGLKMGEVLLNKARELYPGRKITVERKLMTHIR